jgi:bifunctional non-homologous end joining protein LigD
VVLLIPCPLTPMAPALAHAPFHRDGWIYEEKVDGWRMIVYKDGPRVRLISRNGVDHTARFPELAAAIVKLRPQVLVLDGEVAVFDEQLVSRFHLLGESDSDELCTPPMFIGFDVLQVGRRDLRADPLERRRPILEDAIAGSELVLPVRRLDPSGAKAWDIVERRGLEGFVAKDPRSVYRSGPTRSWVKVKLRHEGVFVVGGLRAADGAGGVLVGERVGDELHYRGVVEWGVHADDRLELTSQAVQRESPFADLRTMRGAVWLAPRLRAEISYAEIAAGRLRAPVWRKLVRSGRPDVARRAGAPVLRP